MKNSTKSQNWRAFSLAAVLGLAGLFSIALLFDHYFPLPLAKTEQLSTLVLDREGAILRGFTSEDGYWRLPVTLDQVDKRFIRMLIAYEDQRFYQHPGIDPLALLRAAWQWLWQGEIVSGASTLSMQAVRLLEPIPRSLTGKLWQMLRALQLEAHHSKPEILQLYLQLAPYGGNLEGIRAASFAYFGKEPEYLTSAEAALLVVLPQAPSRLRPDRYPQRAEAARAKVLIRLQQQSLLNQKNLREALQEPIPEQRRPLLLHAPLLARQLQQQHSDQTLLHTTLDIHLQGQLEVLAKHTIATLGQQTNMAMMVVDHQERSVLAHIGSADFFHSAAGQIDLTQAIRSPGSTLKPVVYGMGFEDQIVHPLSLMQDAPAKFGSYQPSNFQNRYYGSVTVTEALQKSLNIPAVALLEKIGSGRLAHRLQHAGIRLYWPEQSSTAGLSLVLGGTGTTLRELMKLYTALATDGQIRPLSYLNTSPKSAGKAVLSPAANWQVRKILQTTPPPADTLPYTNQRQPRQIAYKTGTSYGFRDAWSMGFDDRFVVGVWVGRPDGTPNPGRHGANTAAPLMFRVFALLPHSPARPDPVPPGVLLVQKTRQLPVQLRQFHTIATVPDALRINFPIDGSKLELNQDYLPLQAQGGQKPFRWLVNGQPVPTTGWQQNALWQVDSAGAAHITVLDSSGQTASAEVWLRLLNGL